RAGESPRRAPPLPTSGGTRDDTKSRPAVPPSCLRASRRRDAPPTLTGRRAGRRPPRDPTEDGAGHQARPTRIVVIEEPADHLAGGEKPGNRSLLAVHHLAIGRDPKAPEGERDAGRHGVADERRRVERLGPV